jgi:hypothetical protein
MKRFVADYKVEISDDVGADGKTTKGLFYWSVEVNGETGSGQAVSAGQAMLAGSDWAFNALQAQGKVK